nr:U1 small nuclear ribonucleoprotein C-like [Peromyscus maniculatus bairdii]
MRGGLRARRETRGGAGRGSAGAGAGGRAGDGRGEAAPGRDPAPRWLLSPEQAPDSCSREPPPDTRAPPAPALPSRALPPRRPQVGAGRLSRPRRAMREDPAPTW